MIPLTLGEVATATGGRLEAVPRDRATVTSATLDSRAVEPGALFIAVAGERVDGHDYAAAAVEAGAVGVLAARPVGVPAVVVDDVVVALGRLATAVLDRLRAGGGLPVVGVTGSSGKTTTKDLIAHLLAPLGAAGTVVAPVGSYNNDLGLPLTVLRADPATRALVLEYSARGVGHIARLARIARPTIAVELNVGSAHLGEFGSREAIAAAKAELVEALPPDGVAVLNGDDPLVAAMRDRTAARVVTVGQSETADVRAHRVDLVGGQPSFVLSTSYGDARVALGLHGEHQVGNALAAAAVALELGVPLATVAERLASARPASRWRMEVTERPDGVTVVNDAYNANPESVRAALKTLAAMAGGGTGRSWAVLGPMLELGPAADDEHDAIGRLAVRLDIDRLVAVGPGARRIAAGAALEGSWGEESAYVDTADDAIALLRGSLRPGDVVLVKASRSAGLERVAAALLEEGGA